MSKGTVHQLCVTILTLRNNPLCSVRHCAEPALLPPLCEVSQIPPDRDQRPKCLKHNSKEMQTVFYCILRQDLKIKTEHNCIINPNLNIGKKKKTNENAFFSIIFKSFGPTHKEQRKSKHGKTFMIQVVHNTVA